MMRVYYFGCGTRDRTPEGVRWRAGHYLYVAPGTQRTSRGDEARLPHPFRIPDGTLAPRAGRGEAPQGVAALHHIGGWTAVSFWDRSGDSRPNSNSTFIVEGVHDFHGVVAAAREAFPDVWARFPFEVRPAGAEVAA